MMSNGIMTLLMAILFFILTPGILVSLPPGCDIYTTAIFHSVVFALVWMLIKNPIFNALYGKAVAKPKPSMKNQRKK